MTSAKLVIATLQQQRQSLQKQLQQSQAENERVERENELLRHKLDALCHRLFGKKSERLDPNHLKLALELLAAESVLSFVRMGRHNTVIITNVSPTILVDLTSLPFPA